MEKYTKYFVKENDAQAIASVEASLLYMLTGRSSRTYISVDSFIKIWASKLALCQKLYFSRLKKHLSIVQLFPTTANSRQDMALLRGTEVDRTQAVLRWPWWWMECRSVLQIRMTAGSMEIYRKRLEKAQCC